MSDWVSAAVGYSVYKPAAQLAPSSFVNKAFEDSLDVQKRRSAGLRNLKRPANIQYGFPNTKKPRLQLRAPPPPKALSSRTVQMKFRRRFKRRAGRGRRRFGRKRKKSFGRVQTKPSRLQKQMMRFVETNKIQNVEADFQLFPTDGTAVITSVWAPFSYGLAQGVQTNQFIGNTIFLVGFQVKLRVYAGTDAAAQAAMSRVHVWHMTSRYQSAVGAGGSQYASTTTAVANPAQTDPNGNIPMYDGATPFAPTNWVTPFDVTNVSIRKMKKYRLQTFGQTAGKAFIEKTIWFPIGRKWQIQDRQEGALTAPFFGKWFTHYFCMSLYVGDPTMAAATESYQVGTNITSYWKNVQ